MMNKYISKVKEQFKNMKQYFTIDSDEIIKSNMQSLHLFSIVAFSLSVIMICLTHFLLTDWVPSIFHYIFTFLAFAYMMISIYFRKKGKTTLKQEIAVCTSAQTILLIFLSIFDTVPYPNSSQIFVSLFLMAGSILFIVPFVQMFIGQTVSYVFFIFMAFSFKTPRIARTDLMAATLSYVTSFVVYNVVMKVRVRQSIQKNEYKVSSEKDPMTGIENKASCDHKIRRYISTKDNSESCALFIIDVDNFKSVNDTLGHIKGDEVLISIADILSNEFRKTDVVGRYGGDEFLIFVKDFNRVEFIKNKCENIKEKMKYILDGKFDISCSIGVCFTMDGDVDIEKMFRTADNALYGAKEFRKGNYVINEYNNKRIKEELPIMVIADDSDVDREIISIHFEDEYQVAKFDNGMDAYNFIVENSNKVCVLLLDMVMPEVSGTEILIKIRGNQKTSKIPVVVISSDQMTEEKPLKYGADDMITKPIVPAITKMRVQNAIRKARK